MVTRQQAFNDLYAAYRRAGDDDLNARARLHDDVLALPSKPSVEIPTETELDLAEASYADEDDCEDLWGV